MNLPLKIQRQIEEFARICKLEKVVLFGSRARGTNRERSDKMKKHFRYGLFFALGAMLALGFVACGDESSSGPSKNEETGIETEVSSSSVDEVLSSSVNVEESSSSFESEGLSSSVESGASSSSEKSTESSSGKNTEPAEVSSCSVAEESSSSMTVEPSSSSVKVQESSSSVKVEESSSSAKTDASSSSEKPAESSSSEKIVESSSSEEQSSSSVVENSSSSLESTGICKTKTEDNCVYGSLYDERDGKSYKTVKIGEQEWMAENLNYDVDVIENTSYRSFCEKDSALCSRYGRHYTWAAAIDSISLYTQYSIRCGVGITCTISDTIKIKGVCPSGWHLPKQKEWEQLINFIGASNAGEILKSFTDWTKWPGTDLYGFSAMPSGLVHNASIYSRGAKTSLWTATDHDNFSAQCAEFNYSESRKDVVMLQADTKSNVAGMPVRCIKD